MATTALTYNSPTAIASLLQSHGALIADSTVGQIADANGDKAAGALVATLPPETVAGIVRNFDYTKQSVVAMLVNPKKLAEVIKTAGSLNIDVLSTLSSIVLTRDMKDRGVFFRELSKNPSCIAALASCFDVDMAIYFHKYGKFNEDDEIANEVNIPYGGEEELLFSLKKTAPSTFNKVLELIHVRKAEMTSAEEEEDGEVTET